MPLKHCFSTLGCPHLSLAQVADLARRNRIANVELRSLGGTVDLLSRLTAEFQEPAGLAEFMKERDLSIAALGTSARLFRMLDLSAIKPFIPWAEAAKVPYLRIFDGGECISAHQLTRAARLLEDWQALRRKLALNVDLMIETHDALSDERQLIEFVKNVPSASILWDTHHTWANGVDMRKLWSVIGKNVVHLHVKDSIETRHGDRRYVLPGHGQFPIKDLLRLLEEDNRGLPVSLEWEKLWHPELPSLEDALTAARKWW